MFFGYDCFKDENVFENIVMINNINYLSLSNGKFDEIYITKDLTDTTNTQNNTWDMGNTIFSCHYDNASFGGNIYGNVHIGYIKIKRRRVGDTKWEDLKIIPYEENKIHYKYNDNFTEALETYEYTIQPIGTNGALGNLKSQTIEIQDYDGGWIVSEDEIIQLLYNLEIGDYPTSIPSATIETLGGIFPYVMTNGLTKYRKGNAKCLILSDATVSQYGAIDRKQEKILRQNIMNFLTNKRPKVFKDSSGEYMVAAIIGEPTLTPMNEMGQQLYELSFEFVEVGDKKLLTLHHAGIIK